MRLSFGVIMVMLITVPFLVADTINVPADYPTIQQAIDATVNGDTVMVAPGTYMENIDFLGKAITVTSEQGPNATIIHGDGSDSVVVFASGEVWTTVLKGFKITNGNAQNGGGVRCNATAPTITGNVVKGNTAVCGGGLYQKWSAPKIEYNVFTGNEAEDGGGIYCHKGKAKISYNTIVTNTAESGGGLYCSEGTPVIMGNMICANSALYGGGGAGIHSEDHPKILNNIICWNFALFGGGLHCTRKPILTNNTIVENIIDSFEGGGIYITLDYFTDASISNCIIWGNISCFPGGPSDQISPPSAGTYLWVSHCDIEGGITGGTAIINADPLFVNTGGGDFHIQYGSPCRNTGLSTVSSLPNIDFEGDPRIALGDADIGADEFHIHLYTAGLSTPGGNIEGKFVGLPGTNPVGLFVGSDVLPSPMNTMWGEYWLQAPWFLFTLIPIPSNGILVLPTTLPGSIPAPYDVPMQALIGLNADSLTNLCVLEVR